MKKYKPTPTKKHTTFSSRPALEDLFETSESEMALLTPESEEQIIRLDTIEPSVSEGEMVETDRVESLGDQPTEDASPQPEAILEMTSKPKKRLWSHAAKKTADTNPHSKHKDEIVLKEKREPMNNTPIESNIKEPNAVISKLMNITGNVELETSLLLAGKVVGNIDCKDAIEVYPSGIVEGNINAASIKLAGGEVKGNITCAGILETDSETVINGDITAEVIIVRGKVTGQVKASESVSLSSTAVVKGDLSSATISVEKGAVLEGKYTVAA